EAASRWASSRSGSVFPDAGVEGSTGVDGSGPDLKLDTGADGATLAPGRLLQPVNVARERAKRAVTPTIPADFDRTSRILSAWSGSSLSVENPSSRAAALTTSSLFSQPSVAARSAATSLAVRSSLKARALMNRSRSSVLASALGKCEHDAGCVVEPTHV